jgi:hypothetical protein
VADMRRRGETPFWYTRYGAEVWHFSPIQTEIIADK